MKYFIFLLVCVALHASPNFSIKYVGTTPDSQWDTLFEKALDYDYNFWFQSEPKMDFSKQPIEVFIYPSVTELQKATGNPTPTTDIGFKGDKVAFRKIYLPLNFPSPIESTVRHEVFHAISAGVFGGDFSHRWFDEGMALLCQDPSTYQSYFDYLKRKGRIPYSVWTMFTTAEIENMNDFYGTALLLTQHLLNEIGSKKEFIKFLKFAMKDVDYIAASKMYYKKTPAEVQRGFNEYVKAQLGI